MGDERIIYENDWAVCGYCGTKRPKKKLQGDNCGPDDKAWCDAQQVRNRKATDEKAKEAARAEEDHARGDSVEQLVQDLEAKRQ